MKILLISSFVSCLLLATTAGYAQKNARTTSPIHNLIAITRCTSDGANYNITDSTTYSYSGNRTGNAYATLTSWNYSSTYDTALKYVYDTGAYKLSERDVQLFDAGGNMLSQTKQLYNDTLAGHWLNQSKVEFTYDAHNNMLTKTNEWWGMPVHGGSATWINSYRMRYVYDASNNMIADTTLYQDTTAAWIGYMATLFFYDTHHNETAEIFFTGYTGSWDTSTIKQYWLNAGFKPDSTTTIGKVKGAWKPYSVEKYTYDASYNVLTDTQVTSGVSAMTPYQVSIYTYTGSNMATQERRNNNTWSIPPVWVNIDYKTVGYDAANNMISVINQNWNASFSSYINANKDTNTFSSFNKITNYTTNTWNITKKQWEQQNLQDAQVRFYYDTLPGLYVNNAIENAASINLYPVPASNNMTTSVKWAGHHNIVFDIFDMTGRLYRQWSADMTDTYRSDIPITMLPAGNYMLAVKSNGEITAKQFTVVH